MDLLSVNASTMKGEYTDLTIEYDAPAWAGGGDNPPLVLDKTTMANMPKFNLQMSYKHTFDLGNYGSLVANLDTNFKTKYYNNIQTNVEELWCPIIISQPIY